MSTDIEAALIFDDPEARETWYKQRIIFWKGELEKVLKERDTLSAKVYELENIIKASQDKEPIGYTYTNAIGTGEFNVHPEYNEYWGWVVPVYADPEHIGDLK